MKPFVLLAVLAAAAVPFRVFGATPPRPAVASAPQTFDLSNGARLVVLPEPGADTVVIDVFFRVGLADEGRWHGINALLTRSWVSASGNRGAALLRADIARTGSVGTWSGPDWTELWGVSSADEFSLTDAALTLLTHVVSAPTFPRDAVETGRAEQQRAVALRHDDLLMNVMDRLQARAYGDSDYASPLLGTSDSVAAIPWQQVGEHYRRYFRPNRTVVVVAGGIQPEEAKRIVTSSLGAGGWNTAGPPAPPPARTPPAEPMPPGMRDIVVARHAPAQFLAAGYLAPGLGSPTGRRDYATLLMLDAVLGGGKSSRLFALRDVKGLGYEVHSVIMPGRAQSLWTAYVIGDRPAPEARDLLVAELHALGTGERPVTDAELTRARTYLKARHLEARQRLKERAWGVGWAETMGLGATFDADFDETIDALTADDINRLARAVLGSNPAVAHSLPPAVPVAATPGND